MSIDEHNSFGNNRCDGCTGTCQASTMTMIVVAVVRVPLIDVDNLENIRNGKYKY